jgi:hypothetical protein
MTTARAPVITSVPAHRRLVVPIVWDIVLNAIIPLACYVIAKSVFSITEFRALIVATAFPFLKSVYDFSRHREVDPVAVLVLLGILTSIAVLFLGGDPRILLIRESFFTGAFGIACLVSLAFPRPLMFYFGRHFMAGDDAERRRAFDARWQLPPCDGRTGWSPSCGDSCSQASSRSESCWFSS